MTLRLAAAFGLTISLLFASNVSAVTIPATDLDTLVLGSSVADMTDEFTTFVPPPTTMGTLFDEVFQSGSQFVYTHTVTPDLDDNLLFRTEFPIKGFNGTAGWSFSSASGAGGAGTSADFQIEQLGGNLLWIPVDPTFWDGTESITFFFVSSKGPGSGTGIGTGTYSMTGGNEIGSATSFAPIPEPGSIALLGSGLVGLYTAVRRRRQLKA